MIVKAYMNTSTSDHEFSDVSAWIGRISDVAPNISAFFREDYLQQVNWRALLFEQDFKDRNGKVAAACAARGMRNGICLSFGGNESRVIKNISLNRVDLSSAHKEFYSPSYAIIEERRRFAIISDSDYYWAIGGEVDFLDEICDGKPVEALNEFLLGVDPYAKSDTPAVATVGSLLKRYHSIAARSWGA